MCCKCIFASKLSPPSSRTTAMRFLISSSARTTASLSAFICAIRKRCLRALGARRIISWPMILPLHPASTHSIVPSASTVTEASGSVADFTERAIQSRQRKCPLSQHVPSESGMSSKHRGHFTKGSAATPNASCWSASTALGRCSGLIALREFMSVCIADVRSRGYSSSRTTPTEYMSIAVSNLSTSPVCNSGARYCGVA
mmetsp:Transcript_5259/g.10890  ORF Transcript_5259/g.10890 Transcript_5259/m.10890 type:complete len:200 (-) Transcript_5259:1866-2465(-)